MGYFHIALHAAIPLVLAWLLFRTHWQRAFIIMLATMLVDIDHLLANPVYDPLRCSIGFHPLHQYPIIGANLAACFYKPLRLIGLGLITHMVLDAIDCF